MSRLRTSSARKSLSTRGAHDGPKNLIETQNPLAGDLDMGVVAIICMHAPVDILLAAD